VETSIEGKEAALVSRQDGYIFEIKVLERALSRCRHHRKHNDR
jgi:hypothetical protein